MDRPRWLTKKISLILAVRSVKRGAEKRPPAVRAITSMRKSVEKKPAKFARARKKALQT